MFSSITKPHPYISLSQFMSSQCIVIVSVDFDVVCYTSIYNLRFILKLKNIKNNSGFKNKVMLS